MRAVIAKDTLDSRLRLKGFTHHSKEIEKKMKRILVIAQRYQAKTQPEEIVFYFSISFTWFYKTIINHILRCFGSGSGKVFSDKIS